MEGGRALRIANVSFLVHYIKPTKSILPRVKRGHAYGVPFALLVSLSQVKSPAATAVLLSHKSICTLHALEVASGNKSHTFPPTSFFPHTTDATLQATRTSHRHLLLQIEGTILFIELLCARVGLSVLSRE
jgi:hypothetical protein